MHAVSFVRAANARHPYADAVQEEHKEVHDDARCALYEVSDEPAGEGCRGCNDGTEDGDAEAVFLHPDAAPRLAPADDGSIGKPPGDWGADWT